MKTILFLLIISIPFTREAPLSQTNNSFKKPNLVFILADDCTLWDLTCYGSVDSKTPNIDKLAMEGMKFNNCYQAAPMCSPTRHNIYTGLYPVKSGAYPNHTQANTDTRSMVHYLKPLGYRVALSGKRHINPPEVFPFEYLGKKNNPDFASIESFLQEVTNTTEPFALILCSNEPHTPWNKGDTNLFDLELITMPPHYVDTRETRKAFRNYLAEINFLDDQVGQTMKLLEEYQLEDNTMVIFASEQGNSFPFAKWTCYEAGVKSALIARMPGMINPGTESNAIVEYVDILPTFIDIAGGNKISALDGKSLVPLFIEEKQKIKDYAYSIQTTRGINNGSEYYGIRTVVNDRYRYIWNLTSEVEFLNNVNNSKKLTPWFQTWLEIAEEEGYAKDLVIKYRIRPKEELYDIKKDKWCLVNLAEDKQYASIKKKLRKQLLKWMKACGDEGQDTELQAFEHMPKYTKNN